MNNVELELMGLFATVVEQGSFTGAAEVLGMPKSSAVSYTHLTLPTKA